MSRVKVALTFVFSMMLLMVGAGEGMASRMAGPNAIMAAVNRAAGSSDVATSAPSPIQLVLPIDATTVQPTLVDGAMVYPNVRPDTSYVERLTADGQQALVVMSGPQAPTNYAFRMKMPNGYGFKETSDGSILVLDDHQNPVGVVSLPWAKDANGKDLTTSYRIQDDTIIQTINHQGAVYPVVADPRLSWWWGGVDVYLNRAEMVAIKGGGWGAYTYFVPGGFLGAIGIGAVTAAIDSAFLQNMCVALHLSWVRPSYTWLYRC